MDLLLDPLKSELNWPMGTKRAIDLIEPSTSVITGNLLDFSDVGGLQSVEITRDLENVQRLPDFDSGCE